MHLRDELRIGRRRMFPLLLVSYSLLAISGLLDFGVRADDVNRTGQGQQTPGAGVSVPADPAADAKPTLPGDRPAKEGMDPRSQVHNVDPRDLEGKTHRK